MNAPGAVEGHPAGLGLGLIVLSGGRIDRWLRRYSRSQRFPRHGKSFEAISDTGGWGWNRLAVGPVLAAFPFRTYIALSKIDGAPALVVDYDVPRNPWWQRRVLDELREVIPGIFLGIYGVRLSGGSHGSRSTPPDRNHFLRPSINTAQSSPWRVGNDRTTARNKAWKPSRDPSRRPPATRPTW